jgi:hypothetical protein
MAFEKAVKGKKPVRLVIGGPSGSGKTYTGLKFATYLAGITKKPTAAIDTEFYRASLYANIFPFDVDNWQPPFDPRQLIKAIKEAENAGYGQLVVDSATHFYSAEGGLLQIVQDAAKNKGNNQYAGWATGTPIQNELLDTIIRSPLHLIFCVRSKQGYVENTSSNGKKTYEKVGMELQQRDGFEYDFDFFLMMDMDNNASVQKGMGYLPTGTYVHHPNDETIELILKSITEDTVDQSAIPEKRFVPPSAEEVVKELQASVMKKCQDLGGSKNEKLVNILEGHTSKNPNRIKDVQELKKLEVELIDLEKIMELEKETK